MAIARELVTVLTSKADMTGINQFEAGLNRIKEVAAGVLGAAGIQLGIEKLYEFVDGLIETGKEINKIRAQLSLIARPFDDVTAAMDEVFNMSQRLGISYKDTLDTYKEFANEVRNTKIPQQDVLAAVENIEKGLRVGRATTEQSQRVFEVLQRGFRMGRMRPSSVGLLFDILPPAAFRMLEKYFNTNEEGLKDLAKHGKLTAEAIVNAFKASNEELNQQFDQVPKKLSFAFAYVYNIMAKATAEIWKTVDASVFLAKAIMRFADFAVYYITKVVNALGGLHNTLKLIGIALVAVFGPMFLRMMAMATVAMVRFAAISLAANWPWVLLAASITAVILLIEDFYYWIKGGRSLIGSYLGPFDEFAKKWEGITAPFKAIQDLFAGDYSKFWNDLKESLTTTGGLLTIFVGLIAAVPAEFAVWNAIKFAGLITELLGVNAAVKAVAASATATGSGLGAWALGVLGTAAAGIAALGFTGPAGQVTGDSTPQQDQINAAQQKRKEWDNAHPDEKPGASTPEGGWLGSFWNFLKGTDPNITQPGVQVPPGAVAGQPAVAGNQTNNANITQNNNVVVNTPAPDGATVADAIQQELSRAGNSLLDNVARSIQTSNPRTEAATQ